MITHFTNIYLNQFAYSRIDFNQRKILKMFFIIVLAKLVYQYVKNIVILKDNEILKEL